MYDLKRLAFASEMEESVGLSGATQGWGGMA